MAACSSAVTTTGIYCRAVLPRADAQARKRPLLSHRRRRAGGRLPPLPALPPRNLARPRLLARQLQHGLPRPRPDRGRRARRCQRRDPGGTARPRRAPTAAPVPRASRRLADRDRANPPHSAGETIDPGYAPADDGNRRRRRLRQRPPVQRDLPAALSTPAQVAAPRRHDREAAGDDRRGTVTLGYRPPYDWAAILAFLRARAIPGIESVSHSRYARTIAIGGDRGMLIVEPAANNCLRPPSLSNLRRPAGDHRARPPRLRSCRRPGGDRRASRQDPSWRRLSPHVPACAFPARGMASNSPCAPFSASRSPFGGDRARRQTGGGLWRGTSTTRSRAITA